MVFNPAYPIAIGTLTSFICGIFHTLVTKRINKKGVLDSTGVLVSFIIPGFISGVISTAVQGIGA